MDRRTYLLLTGASLVLVAALLGTPLWDLWYYHPLRSSPGSYAPVAVVVAARARSHEAGGTKPRAAPAPVAAAPERAPSASPPRPVPGESVRLPAAPAVSAGAPLRRLHDSKAPAREEGQPDARVRSPEASPVDAPAADQEEHVTRPAAAAFYQVPPQPMPPESSPDPPRPRDPSGEERGSAHLQQQDLSPDPHPETPTGPPVVSLVPDPSVLTPGDALEVTVKVSDAVSMSSLPFHLSFDPEVLAFVDSQIGPALSGSHEPVLLASVNPNRPGDLAVGLSLVESSGLFSGSGDLLRLRFRALARGESDLAFNRSSMRGATSQPLDVRFETIHIKVQ